MKLQKPDGKIELGTTICSCCHPGQKRPVRHQHTFVTADWWRVGSKPWTRTLLSYDTVRARAIGSETVKEFINKMENK